MEERKGCHCHGSTYNHHTCRRDMQEVQRFCNTGLQVEEKLCPVRNKGARQRFIWQGKAAGNGKQEVEGDDSILCAGKRANKKGATSDMRRTAFGQLVLKHSTRHASRLSGYPRSLHYYRPRKHTRGPHLDSIVLHAVERQAIERLYYCVRRIAAMLRRAGMQVSRKKVHRLMKLANLVRPRSVRKHVIVKRILTVPERPDHLWQHDFQTYQEADSVIGHFFQEYNWNRPHSSLKYMTPKEFYAACGGIK